jgi:hypothetical protein
MPGNRSTPTPTRRPPMTRRSLCTTRCNASATVLFAVGIFVFRKDGSGVEDSRPKPSELLYDVRARGSQGGRRRDPIFQLVEQRASHCYLAPKRRRRKGCPADVRVDRDDGVLARVLRHRHSLFLSRLGRRCVQSTRSIDVMCTRRAGCQTAVMRGHRGSPMRVATYFAEKVAPEAGQRWRVARGIRKAPCPLHPRASAARTGVRSCRGAA